LQHVRCRLSCLDPFSFSDFQFVDIVRVKIAVRFGYSYGYAIVLSGSEKEIKYGFFQKYHHALPQAQKIAASLNCPLKSESGFSAPPGDPLPATIAIAIICLIMFGVSFLKNNSPENWLWAFRIFIIIAFITNFYNLVKILKRDKAE
jgi:hypothetical protein